MGKPAILEGHIIRELADWSRGGIDDPNWDHDRYQSPYIDFSPKTEISCGKMEELEIHVGNLTEAYREERRFKPVKLVLFAVPNLTKKQWGKGHTNYVDFFTEELYAHPDGTLYCRTSITAQDSKDREIPVRVPFAYEVRDLLSIPKANQLLKRNAQVLKEIEDRIAALEGMRKKIRG